QRSGAVRVPGSERARRPVAGPAGSSPGRGDRRRRGHGASQRPSSSNSSTVFPDLAASAKRRSQASLLNSSRSLFASLCAPHSERSRRSRRLRVREVGLTRPTTRKSFRARGVDTERKGGLTAFILQSRGVWAGSGSRLMEGLLRTSEGRRAGEGSAEGERQHRGIAGRRRRGPGCPAGGGGGLVGERHALKWGGARARDGGGGW